MIRDCGFVGLWFVCGYITEGKKSNEEWGKGNSPTRRANPEAEAESESESEQKELKF